MQGLSAYITDLLGNHLAVVRAIPAPDGGNQTFAGVDLNGARTAKVRVAAWDRTAVGALKARLGSRMLKVYYQPPGVEHAKLVFWGVTLRPVLRLGGKVIEVPATCPTARGKRAFAAVLGKPGGATGVTADGAGVEQIWALQVSTAIAVGCPTPGVVAAGGRHGTANPDTKVVISDGQSFQDLVDTVSDADDGPDWDLRPLDLFRDEAPEGLTAGEWADLKASSPKSAFYAQLHTFDVKGNDLRDTVHFGYGTGTDNLADLEVECAGDQTVNVSSVGISGATAGSTTAAAIDYDALNEIGLYCSLTSLSVDAEQGNRAELAQSTADAQIATYSDAPIFLTLTVKKDELARVHAFVHFEHGDFVTVSGESGAILIPYRGEWVKEVPARVTAIGLQQDAQGRVQQTVTAICQPADGDA